MIPYRSLSLQSLSFVVFFAGGWNRFANVPLEQFFPTDYKELRQDGNRNVLDVNTNLPPHLIPRQPICNGEFIPYEQQPYVGAQPGGSGIEPAMYMRLFSAAPQVPAPQQRHYIDATTVAVQALPTHLQDDPDDDSEDFEAGSGDDDDDDDDDGEEGDDADDASSDQEQSDADYGRSHSNRLSRRATRSTRRTGRDDDGDDDGGGSRGGTRAQRAAARASRVRLRHEAGASSDEPSAAQRAYAAATARARHGGGGGGGGGGGVVTLAQRRQQALSRSERRSCDRSWMATVDRMGNGAEAEFTPQVGDRVVYITQAHRAHTDVFGEKAKLEPRAAQLLLDTTAPATLECVVGSVRFEFPGKDEFSLTGRIRMALELQPIDASRSPFTVWYRGVGWSSFLVPKHVYVSALSAASQLSVGAEVRALRRTGGIAELQGARVIAIDAPASAEVSATSAQDSPTSSQDSVGRVFEVEWVDTSGTARFNAWELRLPHAATEDAGGVVSMEVDGDGDGVAAAETAASVRRVGQADEALDAKTVLLLAALEEVRVHVRVWFCVLSSVLRSPVSHSVCVRVYVCVCVCECVCV